MKTFNNNNNIYIWQNEIAMQYLIKFIYLVLHSNMYLCMCFYKVHTSCLLLPCCSKLPLKPFYLLLLRFASFMKIIYGNCWPKIKDTFYFASAVQQTHNPNLLEDKCLFISEYIQNKEYRQPSFSLKKIKDV